MDESWISIVCSLLWILTLLSVSTCGVCLLISWIKNLRANLYIHAWTAVAWTAITICTTLCLLFEQKWVTYLLPTLVVYISGWTMIASWGELIQRRHVERNQNGRSLPGRLFRQSLWGPLALWVGCIGIGHLMDAVLWNAVDNRDITRIHLLGEYGFSLNMGNWRSDENYWRMKDKFAEAVRSGDLNGVSTCVEAAPFLLDDVLSSSNEIDVSKNLAVLRLVLDYYKSTGKRPELINAITGNNVEAARLLIWNGADPNAETYFKDDNRTMLWIARNQQEIHHWSKAMIRLLKDAGAKE